ncbi:MAG: class I SAM-dependent methyltransferase [Gracilimonas sp.]|uniref:O-methyltransferase n=1 Tax=Gracilimonas sp. TaxID=1974203 RepID=UPI0019A35335|nr:class I SAM-dependent methyltransferase [Gracilimonas sp.]MBD3615572.1 class I SAM-dependent methyltransferase [Gracilimonas sp.]
MKKHRDTPFVQITDQDVEQYALEMTSAESEQIKELVALSDQELEFIDMLSGNLVGQMLKMLIKLSGAKRVLEIGTFTGYSALMMAEALPGEGQVITIEMNLRYQELAEKHFERFDAEDKIRLLKGNARELMDELEGEFDLVFLDADKISYPLYFEKSIAKLKSGGMLIVDNVLWNGTVLHPDDEKAAALNQFNKMVADDLRVEQVLLPVRDGLSLIRKK